MNSAIFRLWLACMVVIVLVGVIEGHVVPRLLTAWGR